MSYVILDFETTGLIPSADDIIEIAALRLDENFDEIASYHTLVQLAERLEVPEFITGLTGLTTEQVNRGTHLSVAMDNLVAFIGTSVVVAQFAPFDLAFLHAKSYAKFQPLEFICTKSLTSLLEPSESSKLEDTCKRLGIELDGAHRAMNDVRATAELLRVRAIEFEDNPPKNTLVISEDRPLGFIPKSTESISLKGGGKLYEKK